MGGADARFQWKSAGGSAPEQWDFRFFGDLLETPTSIMVGVMYPGGDTPNGIPLVKVNDVKNGQIQATPTYCVSEEVDEQYKKTRLNGTELLITLVGEPGDCVVADSSMEGWNVARALAVARLKDPSIRPWIRHVLLSAPAKHLIDARLNTTVQKTLNLKDVKQLGIPLPPKEERDSISSVVGSLDDKIELNRRMNETLEGMAQTLFKSWFVDFDPVIDNALAAGNPIPEPLAQRAETRRQAIANGTANLESAQAFPASFRFTEELGWIPEGWEVKEANEAADISIGKTPPRKQQEWFSDISSVNIVWVSIKDMGTCGVFINDSSEYLTSESIEKFNVKVVPKGSVILSFKLTVGRVAIADTSLATNEAIAHFTDLKNGLTKEFIYSYLKQFDYNDLGSTSSIATAVNSKIIKAMPVLIPHVQVLAAFSQTCQNWFGLIRNQQYQSQTLAKLRDVLLPKLISGELRIPQAEKMVEQAVA